MEWLAGPDVLRGKARVSDPSGSSMFHMVLCWGEDSASCWSPKSQCSGGLGSAGWKEGSKSFPAGFFRPLQSTMVSSSPAYMRSNTSLSLN